MNLRVREIIFVKFIKSEQRYAEPEKFCIIRKIHMGNLPADMPAEKAGQMPVFGAAGRNIKLAARWKFQRPTRVRAPKAQRFPQKRLQTQSRFCTSV
jgi:hypothetical protein